MGLAKRPKHLPQVQALAAIGQCRLMGLWEEMFQRLDQNIAQILLTRNDIADRTQYLNAQNTFVELLNMGVIPIVNENDTIAVSEIKFGDNDTLSAITAGMVSADYLFLMTDVDCLYDKNPRTNPTAKPIEVVENVLDLAVDVSSAGSTLGTGGMSTKIVAARLATAAGVTTIITRSSLPGNVASIVNYLEAKKAESRNKIGDNGLTGNKIPITINPPPLHTRFLPSSQRIRDRQFWLLHGLNPHGTLFVDHGAARALSEGRGLLPVGIVDVHGSFAQQECVRILETFKLPKPSDLSHNPVTQNYEGSERESSLNDSFRGGTNLAPIDLPEPAGGLSSMSSSGTLAPPREDADIGRAIVNYSSIEIKRIAGRRSSEISGVLGYADTEYVAFRENVALFLDVKSEVGTPERTTITANHTPMPGTPSTGRTGIGLGGYVEG